MHELKWSHAEKIVARRAFDKALGAELEALIREVKSRTARIEEFGKLADRTSAGDRPEVRLPVLRSSTHFRPPAS
jgi:hypothetical protein